MSIQLCLTAKCDYCPRYYSSGTLGITSKSYSKAQFVKDIRKRGWSVGKSIACPECKAEGKTRMKLFRLPE